jgi:hypothetical protein
MRDTDTLGYFPLQGGSVPPSSPRMRPIPEGSDEPRDQFFLFDEHFPAYRAAKDAGRDERVGKYYRRLAEDLDMRPVIAAIVGRLPAALFKSGVRDGLLFIDCLPSMETVVLNAQTLELVDCTSHKHNYLDAFDALAMQLQCDLVLQTVRPDGSNYASHIHLFHPNGWSAEEFIGRSFAEIHSDVKKADGSLVIPGPDKMVQGLVQMTRTVERVGAISWRQSNALNRHPDTFGDGPVVFDFEANPNLFLRFERQTVVGVPETRSFLFSIHSLFIDLTDPRRIEQAVAALRNPHPDNYTRDRLKEDGDKFLAFLESRRG